MNAVAAPRATRAAAKDALLAHLESDDRVVCVDTDTGLFGAEDVERCGDRYVDVGIAEHSAVSIAAGLAREGLRPLVCMFAAFAVNRAADAIKIDLAYNRLPVTVVATHAGLSAGFLGPTHHCLEDLALMRTFPGMSVLVPGDADQVETCMALALESAGPTYLRLGRRPSPMLPATDAPWQPGEPHVLRDVDGDADVVVLACGPEQLAAALAAAEELSDVASVRVVNVPSVKPLPVEGVLSLLPRHDGLVVTLEEHWHSGGLGDAVAEVVAVHAPRRVVRLAVPDTFRSTPGPHDFQLRECGLDAVSIAHRVRRLLPAATSP